MAKLVWGRPEGPHQNSGDVLKLRESPERVQCRPVINKPPPSKGLNIRIPIVIPIKGSGLIN